MHESQAPQLFCFLDVLGFSDLVRNRGLQSLYADYRELVEAAGEQRHDGLVFSSWQGTPYFGVEKLESAYFSDTIVFWSPYHSRLLQSLCYSMMEVLCRSIEIGLPLRGAISAGEAILNKETSHFIGRPIVNAVEAEKVQQWIGVTLSKDFRDAPFNRGFSAACFMPWERHLKDGGLAAVTPLVLDYPRWWRSTRNTSLEAALGKLDREPRFTSYYRNAIDFAIHSAANPKWWESHANYRSDDG
jgi:hypothetical protein